MSRSHQRQAHTLSPDTVFELEDLGADLECRVRLVGTAAGGAVARAHWCGSRARTEVAAGAGGRDEQRIARDCAQHLCRAARRPVTCTVSLGRAGPDQAEDLSRSIANRTLAACQELDLARLRVDLAAPSGVLASLEGPRAERLQRRVESWLARPLAELKAEFATRVSQDQGATPVDSSAVLIFAPLYLSNACLNDCSYCGFRKSKRIARLKLDRSQALAEARCLASHGHRTLDLVAGEIPTDAFVDYVCEVCSTILSESPIERIHLNLGALSRAQYARLLAAGASGYHLYQETYAPDVFLRVHGRGPKRDMAGRLEGARRALEAGFKSIGLGVLLGLGPLARDLALLARHAQVLRTEYPGTGLGFSLPRIQDAGQEPGFVPTAAIDDETFVKAFLFLALEFPQAHLTLTTRERPAMRDALLPLGVTKLSAGVSTAAGGYGQAQRKSEQQFSISDERTLEEVACQVRSAGRVPKFR